MAIISPRYLAICTLPRSICSYNIATDQPTIQYGRGVVLSTQARTVDGEARTDNTTVTLPGGATAIATAPLGISYRTGSNVSAYNPNFNTVPSTVRDCGIPVIREGDSVLEVAPGAIITKGSNILLDAQGRATDGAASPTVTTTTWFTISESTTATFSTATNAGYIKVVMSR